MNLKLISAVSIACLISFLLQWWQPNFLYVRESVNHGEWWRIISGQLVHTNWPHFALNISSLVLFTMLFYNTMRARTFTISLFLLVLCVGLCLHFYEPRIFWYAGLSGAIYGLYLVGAYTAYLSADRLIAVGVALLVIGKVLFDHFFDPLQDNSALIGARVVTESHLYGMLSAIVLCGLNYLYRMIKPTLNK